MPMGAATATAWGGFHRATNQKESPERKRQKGCSLTNNQEVSMPYAKFERAEPREWREIPFSYDDAESLPSLPEIIGWILLGGMFISLMFLTFCME